MTGTGAATAIRTATAPELEALTELLADAFLTGPLGTWLVHDLIVRHRVLVEYFGIHIDHAHQHGHIHVTGDLSGVALWLPHTAPELADYDERLQAACGPWLNRFQHIDDRFLLGQPVTPHHHLAYLAVTPHRQRTGIGSALLRHHHRRLDELGVPAYLAASTEAARDLCLSHGYQPWTREPITLPDGGPPVWPMFREHHADAAPRDLRASAWDVAA
jgi:GNAT superfamily N-acetyltransferase